MRVGEYRLINNFKLEICTNLGHLLKNLITSGVMPKENFQGWTRVGTAYSVQHKNCHTFLQIVTGMVRTASKGSRAKWWILLLK